MKRRSSKPARTTKRRATPARPERLRAAKVVLLSGGNPQIAKADGDAPVQAYIAALSGWQREKARCLDALVGQVVPGVEKAVKWNSPLYGAGRGWFLSMHAFTKFLRITFFRGASLDPPPPGPSKVAGTRYLDLYEADVPDDARVRRWVEQAAAQPGWVTNQD